MNDIAKGGVCTGRDARTVRFVFDLFVVAWRDSPISEYLNHTPEAQHSQRKKRTEKRNDKRKNDHPWNHTYQLWPTKAPKILKTSSKQTKIQEYKVLSQNPNPAPTKFRTPVLKPTTLTSHPHIQYSHPLISDQCNWMRSTTTKKWSVTSRRDFPTIVDTLSSMCLLQVDRSEFEVDTSAEWGMIDNKVRAARE